MDRTTLSNPSIGISLTASYGYGATNLGGNEITLTDNLRTISLRHSDSSFEDLGHVDGDFSYIAMIRRLSSRAACHPRYTSQSELFPNIQLPPY